MLEWLSNSNGFSGPADSVHEPPRASLRLSHVELATQEYLNDPALGLNEGESVEVDPSVARIVNNRKRLDDQRARIIEDRAREQVELEFGSFTYAVKGDDSVRILRYNGDESHVVIPERINGAKVTALDSSLFFENETVETVIMPDTIEMIGHRLFEKCSNLKYVRFSASLKQVGSGTFARCNRIDKVQVNVAKSTAEKKLFSGATIGEVEFGPDVVEIDFSEPGIRSLERISVDPANPVLTTDGLALFADAGKTMVRLIVPCPHYEVPQGCERVADKAFDSMHSLHSVTLPQTLKSIGKLAFAKTALRSISLPEGLESIGEKAFFYCASLTELTLPASLQFLGGEALSSSGVKRVAIPYSLRQLGARIFDKTPVQEKIAQGSLTVYGNSDASFYPDALKIDKFGGMYVGDTFLELIGQVENYVVAEGTTAIADEACIRHRALRFISIPEGVETIGRDAFRGAKHLTVVELPESLRVIGARAFADTAIHELRISATVEEIGENALLVQGENPMTAANPLERVDIDPANKRFYLQNGLLCKRGGGKRGGDSVVLYLGPENVVRIPEAVTQIDNLAFCGSINLEELYLHDHVYCICTAALSTRRAIGVLHLRFSELVEGVREVRLIMPEYTTRYRSIMPLFESSDRLTRFNFEYYDTWVACSTEIAQFAPAALARLRTPVRLCNRCREMFEGTFTRKAQEICAYFAGKGDLEALVQLCDWGYLTQEHIEAELARSLDGGEAQKTGCLLEARKRLGTASAGIDFSL